MWRHERIGVSTLKILLFFIFYLFFFQKYYSGKQLSVTVQVKWTQSGENLFLLSSSRMRTMLAPMNRINKRSGGSKHGAHLDRCQRGRWQFDSTRFQLWIFMHCRNLVNHTRDLVYMPTLSASCSQCDAAVAGSAAVHCNT